MNGWSKECLKRKLVLNYGETLTQENRDGGNILVYGSNGVVGSHNFSVTNGATIIIGRKGSAGKVTWSSESCYPIDTTYFIDCTTTKENLRWLYFLLSDMGLDRLNQNDIVPGLNRSQVNEKYAYFPPVEEQRRIAAFLDQQCAAIDGAIAVKQQQLEKFDTLGKTVLSKAVLEGLDDNAPKRNPHSLWFSEIPAHWDIRRLKDVSTMQTGITLGKDYDEPTEERPYLRVANVQDGHLALDDMKTINLPPALIPRYQLQPGDVLMTEGGDLDKLGRGYVWNNELPGCLHQNHVFALRCQPHKLLPDYLAMLTSSTHGRAYFEITGKKTTNLASTNATKVNLFPIPLPPVAEQARIVAWVKAELDKIQQARAVVSRQVEVLAEYKKSLIHECVTGKRRVVV